MALVWGWTCSVAALSEARRDPMLIGGRKICQGGILEPSEGAPCAVRKLSRGRKFSPFLSSALPV